MAETERRQPPQNPEGFRNWALAAANALEHRTARPPFGPQVPGSFAEAVAFLTSERALAPDPPDGLPACYAAGLVEAESMVAALYEAAFVPFGVSEDTGLRIYVWPDSGNDPMGDLEAEVVGVRFGEERDSLVFSEPHLRIKDLACEGVEDLRKVHALVLSAARRA